MNCEESRAFLQDLIDGTLSGPAREVVEEHRSHCALCAAESRTIASLHRVLRAQPVLPVPQEFVDRVVRRVTSRPVTSLHHEFVRFALAAAATLGIAIGVSSLNWESVRSDGTLATLEQGLRAPLQQIRTWTHLFWKE